MPRPSLSYANVMSTIAVFLALGGSAWAVTGQLAQEPQTVTACVTKAGKAKGQLRVVAATAPCKTSERKLRWTSASTTPVNVGGPAGPAGSRRPRRTRRTPGPRRHRKAPQDPRARRATPARRASRASRANRGRPGARTRRSRSSPSCRPSTGRAPDSTRASWTAWTRPPSSAWTPRPPTAMRSTGSTPPGSRDSARSSGGLISVGGIGAHSCADLNIGLGSVDPGDLVVVRPGDAITLPAGIIMQTGSPQSIISGNLVSVRFCNVTNSAFAGFGSFPLRWFAIKPW